jgi:hypothetical protein
VTRKALRDNDSRDTKSHAAQQRSTKRCPGCVTVKPLADFALDRSRKTGIATYCLRCYIERSRRVTCVDCGAKCQRSRRSAVGCRRPISGAGPVTCGCAADPSAPTEKVQLESGF